MEFLKLFDTEANYNSVKADLVVPNVSCIENNNKIFFNAKIPNDEIWYVSGNGVGVITPANPSAFGATILSNTYENGKGVIKFNGPVTQIGNSAFEGNWSLREIVIPDSVTSIGAYAFSRCDTMPFINIPKNVTSIGVGAFYQCAGLAKVKMPNSVKTIDSFAFYGCSALASIGLSGDGASLEIPHSVTWFGNALFADCQGLTSITIPYSLGRIPDSWLSGCRSLTSVDIHGYIDRIESGAFQNCTSLTELTWGRTIEDWNSVEKDYGWNNGSSIRTVHCTNGDVTI